MAFKSPQPDGAAITNTMACVYKQAPTSDAAACCTAVGYVTLHGDVAPWAPTGALLRALRGRLAELADVLVNAYGESRVLLDACVEHGVHDAAAVVARAPLDSPAVVEFCAGVQTYVRVAYVTRVFCEDVNAAGANAFYDWLHPEDYAFLLRVARACNLDGWGDVRPLPPSQAPPQKALHREAKRGTRTPPALRRTPRRKPLKRCNAGVAAHTPETVHHGTSRAIPCHR